MIETTVALQQSAARQYEEARQLRDEAVTEFQTMLAIRAQEYAEEASFKARFFMVVDGTVSCAR